MIGDLELLTALRQALSGPLPGLTAQITMAPEYRKEELRHLRPLHTPRQAGVLILLYPAASGLAFVLTRRADNIEFHRGQISLPGGAWEDGESLAETALREAYEEVGIEPGSVELLGELTELYIPVSGFCVHPFVGFSPERPSFHPDPVEVAEVIELPLAVLLDAATARTEVWELRGVRMPVPFFQVENHQVWGATAMMLAELRAVVLGIVDPPA